MTKIATISYIGTLVAVTTLPAIALAASFDNPLRANDLFGILNSLIAALIKIGAVLVVLFFIFAGFQLVIANGNDKKIADAKRALLYCVIGAIILLGAQAILTLVTSTICSVSPAACQ